MSDFFASLAARNLGVAPDTSSGEAAEVRPRPKAAFEAEGAGVMPDAPELPGDRTEPETAVAPVPSAPDGPVSAAPQTARDRMIGPKRHAGAPTPPAPPAPSLAPAPHVTAVRTEIVSAPASATLSPTTETRTEPSATRMPAEQESALPPRSEPGPRRVYGPVQALMRPDVSAPAPDRKAPDRNVPTARNKTTSTGTERRQAHVDVPLERIVRQMVLMPRPEHRPSQSSGKELDRAPLTSAAPDTPRVEPVAAPPLAPLPRDAAPERRVRDPAPLVLRDTEATRAPARPLAPIPAPPMPPEPKAPETVIRVRIGRIVVNAGPAEASSREAGPKRPEPTLMSLDDYLRSRSSEAGR